MIEETDTPGMMSAMVSVAKRDLVLAWKRPGDVLNPLFFFAMVATLFPLAVGPSNEQLEFSGPGVLWTAALLATLLSLNNLFVTDYEDGSLDQMLVSPVPLPALVLGKSIAHWLTSGLPLVLISPVVAITFRMPISVTGVLMLTLLLGTISLSMLGSIGAALPLDCIVRPHCSACSFCRSQCRCLFSAPEPFLWWHPGI
jgi:heme exporter protein B